MKTIDFYFDFLSPYAYYARHRLVQIAAEHGAAIRYLPADLKRLKLAAGNTGPATVQMPRKLAYAISDFQRWAERYGIPAATSPACFDSKELNLGVFHAIEQGRAAAYVESVFAAVWGQGGAKQAPALILQDAAQYAGLDLTALQAAIASESAAKAAEAVFEQATARGVFGVPTMVLDGQLWWGNDRLFMLEEQLAHVSQQAH